MNDFLNESLKAFLARKTPPRPIANDAAGQAAESAAMARVIARYAPRDHQADWWQRFEADLLGRMKTHSWPLASEIEASCRAVTAPGQHNADTSIAEARIIAQMADHYRETRREHPIHGGKPHRTLTLIRDGVLQDLREARFRGFALTSEQLATARSQPMGMDEWKHHVSIMAYLKGIDHAEAEAVERAALSPSELPISVSSLRVSQSTEGFA